MELFFVVLGGAFFGLVCRRLIPNRDTHGVVLIPALGAGISAVLWVGLTWLGLEWNRGAIWWITAVATIALVTALDFEIGRRRTARDTSFHDLLLATGCTGEAATGGPRGVR